MMQCVYNWQLEKKSLVNLPLGLIIFYNKEVQSSATADITSLPEKLGSKHTTAVQIESPERSPCSVSTLV